MVLLGFPAVAGARPFGGFSRDETRVLEGRDWECTPAQVSTRGKVTSPGSCRRASVVEVTQGGYTKPAPGRVEAQLHGKGDCLTVSLGDRRVVAHGLPTGAEAVIAYLSPDGKVVAVELRGAGGAVDTLSFAMPPAPSASPPTTPAGPTAHSRAMARGGVWEQRLIPCDQAGVTLRLSDTGTFALTVRTRCQASRDELTLEGKWDSEGAARLRLIFVNDDATEESLECRIAVCPGGAAEDCVTCQMGELSFVLETVQRQ